MLLFYHVTRSGAEEVVRFLLGRAGAQGWRVMIRSPDAAQLERLDRALWQHPADGFIPHGLAGGAHDADQPVLLGQGAALNTPQGVILLSGAEATAEEVAQLPRVWVIFESADFAQLEQARLYWKRMVEAGAHAQYWSEDSGRWQMKFEKGGG